MTYPGETLFPRGSSWLALDTPMNCNKGITAGTKAFITFGDTTHFSLYINPPVDRRLKIPRALFSSNFKREFAMPIATFYIGTKHATVDY